MRARRGAWQAGIGMLDVDQAITGLDAGGDDVAEAVAGRANANIGMGHVVVMDVSVRRVVVEPAGELIGKSTVRIVDPLIDHLRSRVVRIGPELTGGAHLKRAL